jgi:ribokinase
VAPTRRALTLVEDSGERTITTIGDRLAPAGEDPLPWERLDGADCVYFTAGDAGALRAARTARVLVATPRAGQVLHRAAIPLDTLVFSDRDEDERAAAEELEPKPALVVATEGADGGRYSTATGEDGRWEAEPPPGPIADTYGSGDSFAAALAWALASGRNPGDAVRVAARAGAVCMTGRGPYERQLTA